MLDLLRARRTVKTAQYNPGNGTFSFAFRDEYGIELTAATCKVRELAQAIHAYHPVLSSRCYYLSALLLDQKSEIPIPTPGGYTFGSFAVLQTLPDSDIKHRTTNFMAFRNALRVLYRRVALSEVFIQHGDAVRDYGATLEELCDGQPALKARLAEQETDSRMLASTEPREFFTHTGALLDDLAAAQDWGALCQQAQRHLGSLERTVAIRAKRMLALGLAHSDNAPDAASAIEIYRSLISERPSQPADRTNLAILLVQAGRTDDAKAVVLDGIRMFPGHGTDYLLQIGQRIVEATGDRAFRKQIEEAIAERQT